MSSSARTYHGPTCSRPVFTSARTSVSRSGRAHKAILRRVRTRLLVLAPAAALVAALATRLVPGPRPDGSTLLPSGWRIRPAGRQVTVGTLPLSLVTLSDGSLLVTNNGYGANGLMRIDPAAARVIDTLPLRAAWLGLARAGGAGVDTVWASGGGTNRVFRFVR